jgi:hypothetical protein
MSRRILALTAVALAATLGTAACGGPVAPPPSPGTGGISTPSVSDPVATATTTAPPTTAPTTAPPAGDCVNYDETTLTRVYAAGVHSIRTGTGVELIRVFGAPDDPDGVQALRVATKFTRICYIGRASGHPSTIYEYWQNPSTVYTTPNPSLGTACIDYNPAMISVFPFGGGWRVASGELALQDLATEADANAVRAHLTQQDVLCKVDSRTPAPEDAYAAITFTLWTTD